MILFLCASAVTVLDRLSSLISFCGVSARPLKRTVVFGRLFFVNLRILYLNIGKKDTGSRYGIVVELVDTSDLKSDAF